MTPTLPPPPCGVAVFIRGSAIGLCLALSPPPLWAGDWSWQLQPSMTRFQVLEYGAGGSRLVRESGWIPGLALQLERQQEWGPTGFVRLESQQGSIDYAGRTSLGQAHSTRTDTRRLAVSLGLEHEMALGPWPLGMVLALSHQRWDRDIQPRGSVRGLEETYHWSGIRLALGPTWRQDGRTTRLRLGVQRPLEPRLEVKLDVLGYGTATLHPRPRWGPYAELSLRRDAGTDSWLGLVVRYDEQRFAASDRVTLYSGTHSLTLREPELENRQLQIGLTWSRRL